MSTVFAPRNPLANVVDLLLADVAVRIQLSPTHHRLAVDRYDTVNNWIERDESPLKDRVEIFYPQGSMSIGSTIASKLETDEFDIDLIAQINLPLWAPAHQVLNILEEAIRGEYGSRYYSMTTRCTRCIQIQYSDGMHLDVTPMLRLPHLPERCGFISHAKERYASPEDRSILANPFGFSQHFNLATPAELEFADAFSLRERAFDSAIVMDRAESEPVPEQVPAHRKSKAVIALQLLKRWRNIRYDTREGRRPASVLLAKLVADYANRTDTLSSELLYQAKQILAFFEESERRLSLVEVRNPACQDDVFTDRWPGSLTEQRVFINDLRDLVKKLERLVSGCGLAEIQDILVDLFGERPAQAAVKGFNQTTGDAIVGGRSFHDTQGGRFDLGASGVTAATPSIVSVRATPKHTNFGSG